MYNTLLSVLISMMLGNAEVHDKTIMNIDASLLPYVIEYNEMMNNRGVIIDWNLMNVYIRFSDIQRDDVIGVALGMNHSTVVSIIINKNIWSNYTVNQKKWVIFHELSHDLFDIKHNEIELMMPALPRYVTNADLNRVFWGIIEHLKDNKKWNINN